MYQFFVEDEQVQQDRICIVGGDVNHIGHVLRIRAADRIFAVFWKLQRKRSGHR